MRVDEYAEHGGTGAIVPVARNAKYMGGNAIVLKWGGTFPYKVIGFNYADQPNRLGLSPLPPITDDTGSLLHGAYYEYAIKQGIVLGGQKIDPDNVAWTVPGGGSVTLCGACIERSELGNFMLGYFAYYAGLSEEDIVGAAIAIGGSQRAWDEAAIRFGSQYAVIHNKRRSESLCGFLSRAGITQMVDSRVSGFTPSARPLHTGFGHFA